MKKHSLRALFLIQGYGSPSNRVRVMDLVSTLEKAGIRCVVTLYPRGVLAKLFWALRMRGFDVVVLQKKLLSRFSAMTLKKISRRLIFDFDDATHLRHDAESGKPGRSIETRTITTIRAADAVVAGNRVLKEFAKQFNDNVYVVPSCVDVSAYPTAIHNPHSANPTIIGWIGSTANLHHLSLISDVLRNISIKHDIVLHVVSGKNMTIPGVPVHFIPWSLDGQGQAISEFDIGIMPLENSMYSACKCGYKALQCMAAGIPVVVSNVGGNADVVTHGIDGLLANNLAEFEAHLSTLILNPELRASMGARARAKVIEQYSVEVGGNALARILDAVVNRID